MIPDTAMCIDRSLSLKRICLEVTTGDDILQVKFCQRRLVRFWMTGAVSWLLVSTYRRHLIGMP